MFLLLFIGNSFAQSPGIIIRPAAGAGATPLNPNGDGFSSSSTNGFVSSDITESEVPYKIVPPAFPEPTSDLLRGPAQMYSDLVRQVDGSGFYIYNDGTNLLFRLRVGNVVSGSKGYSVLIDTDGKIGSTGAYADPNYQAATTGVNGNPGFELEVVLETNFRVAVYNVDGASTPTLMSSYPINSNSQISIALSTVSGTPDYFYDFYVPISALGVTAGTPLRMVATTVMAPKPAIGGPKSDIYGVDDSQYKDPMKSWEAAVTNTPTYTLSSINSGGGGVGPACTAAPTLNGPIQAGAGISVSGSWTALDASKPSTATITLFKNGIAAGTTTVTSTNTWTISGITVVSGDVLYAKAQATGESQCLQSSSVKVLNCTPANTSSTTGFAITCSSERGFEGTRALNTSVKIYQVTTAGVTLFADDATTTYKVTYPTTTTFRYDDVNSQSGQTACSGGGKDLNKGTYIITVTESGKCESAGTFVCVNDASPITTATPVISQTTIYTGATTVSGTAVAGSTVWLYTNGKLQGTTTATGGNYSFTNLALTTGDVVSVMALSTVTDACASAAATRTVSCFITSPVITTDNNGNLSSSATAISGTSGEAAGSTITVLENGVSVGTTTVQANGTWSLNYTPVSGKSYTATLTNGGCISPSSNAAAALAPTTVCPSITGTYKASDNTISGTFPSSFTGKVRLYIDGDSIGEASIAAATSWSITVNSNYRSIIYAGGVLTVTSQATGNAEKTDCSSSTTVGCPAIPTPSISPTSSNIHTGQTVPYTVSPSTSGFLYAVADASTTTTNYTVSQWGTGSNLAMTTYPFNTAGTYNIQVNAISFSGSGCVSSSAATVVVSTALPVTLLYFTGRYEEEQSKLTWETTTEDQVDRFVVERSDDGRLFTEIGTVKATGNSNFRIKYNYTDSRAVAKYAWYRLRMVDIDGKIKYTSVIRLVNNTRNISVLSVTPNPFENTLRVQVNSDKVSPATVRIVDLTGREMYRLNSVLMAGNNNIPVHPSTALASGVYVLQLIVDNEVILNQKVQKVK
ncbi:hypothetical protein A4D02_07180 [Niastella koreensis]|uniref:Secretion system C-terminal sorting domain-containing protein n=1 Tax=Niastella koreensis TaxID=354356 RepID=A0ABX3NY15_9BACT|nr:hypothetical protein A4D02_07180 [Niastella koreensis]